MLDFNAFYTLLANEVRTSTDFNESMHKLLDWGSKAIPHDGWAALKALDCSSETSKVGPWLSRVLKRSPCPFPVRGIYFGIAERATRARVEYADLYFGLMGEYQPTDEKFAWLWRGPKHYPSGSYFRSEPLKTAGLICNEDEEFGLSTPGHIVFSLGFSALLLRSSLSGDIFHRLNGTEPIGIVTGFDSGDLLRIGTLQNNGFMATKGSMEAE